MVPENDTTLKVIYKNDNYYIQPGLAFFGNGSTLEVITEEIIKKNEHETTYVFLESDEINNRNYIAVSEFEPDTSNENIVYLAEIALDGKIIDHRSYAVGKVVGYQNNFNGLKKQVISHSITDQFYTTIEQELQTADLKFMIIISDYSVGFISLEENYNRWTMARDSYNYKNHSNYDKGVYVGRTTYRELGLTVNISKKEGTANTYIFSYKQYSAPLTGGTPSFGTINYTIYYV